MIELIDDKILFGRDSVRCDVVLSEPQISGIHAQICRNLNHHKIDKSQDSHLGIVTDLSTNGTFINKRKIGKSLI